MSPSMRSSCAFTAGKDNGLLQTGHPKRMAGAVNPPSDATERGQTKVWVLRSWREEPAALRRPTVNPNGPSRTRCSARREIRSACGTRHV
ncbi:hypothetical protein CHELA41_30084 [Hyphomicrobiales bacterium]|nr:hypothetical protein CHELA41_30084 [Hyphomicrobiales bacterium]